MSTYPGSTYNLVMHDGSLPPELALLLRCFSVKCQHLCHGICSASLNKQARQRGVLGSAPDNERRNALSGNLSPTEYVQIFISFSSYSKRLQKNLEKAQHSPLFLIQFRPQRVTIAVTTAFPAQLFTFVLRASMSIVL